MKSIESRLAALECKVDKLHQHLPAKITVTLKDGRQIITDPIGAIELWQGGEVAQVDTERDDYAELCGVLTALT